MQEIHEPAGGVYADQLQFRLDRGIKPKVIVSQGQTCATRSQLESQCVVYQEGRQCVVYQDKRECVHVLWHALPCTCTQLKEPYKHVRRCTQSTDSPLLQRGRTCPSAHRCG